MLMFRKYKNCQSRQNLCTWVSWLYKTLNFQTQMVRLKSSLCRDVTWSICSPLYYVMQKTLCKFRLTSSRLYHPRQRPRRSLRYNHSLLLAKLHHEMSWRKEKDCISWTQTDLQIKREKWWFNLQDSTPLKVLSLLRHRTMLLQTDFVFSWIHLYAPKTFKSWTKPRV